MKLKKIFFWENTHLLLLVTTLIFFTAFIQIYFRTQTILVGYDIGRLQSQEALLIKQTSTLKLQLTKITSKESLLKRIK